LKIVLASPALTLFRGPQFGQKRLPQPLLPNQLYEELERFVSESKGQYVSVAEVIREAVRDFLERKRSPSRKN
jgi:hypothetical protein